jgi:hypothetical protein
MLYKFRSKAAGDVIMLGPSGDQVMRLIGRDPAVKGIFEVQDMPALMAQLEHAVAVDEQARQAAADRDTSQSRGDGVTLRQRVWPLIDMLRRCHRAGEVIVWGG